MCPLLAHNGHFDRRPACPVLGVMRFTYGAVLLFHAISAVSAYQQYISPFESHNLLFYAAWPMLAACLALYTLRDLDTLWTIRGKA